jgi:Domain of unknown function (DUF4304)
MSRDYTNFSTVAKRRFRPVADALGYEQLSPTVYAKARDGWHESFNLQSSHGTDVFYVNYGITVPQLCPVGEDRSILTCGHLLGSRLRDADGTGGFPRGTIREIETSAERVVEQYRLQALPWFASVGSWQAMADEYLRVTSISEAQIGSHSSVFGEGPRCATYGFLLLKAGRRDDALRWLREAERILSLPEYITRDGRLVHVKEKYARLQRPEAYAVETLMNVQQTIAKSVHFRA